jgi:O-antigen biosynthesis protein WbqV
VEAWLDTLDRAVARGDRAAAERVFEEAIPEFRRRTQTIAPAPPAPPALEPRAAIQRA